MNPQLTEGDSLEIQVEQKISYPKCRTCRFYTPHDAADSRMCTAPRVLYRFKLSYAEISEEIRTYGLIVEDDEGWGMIPGPEFGCVLHQPVPVSDV